MPYIFKMRTRPHIGHLSRAKAGDTFSALVAHAAIQHTVRSRSQKFRRQSLGIFITRRIAISGTRAHVVERRVEIGPVKAHLHSRFEYSDFRQLLGSVP